MIGVDVVSVVVQELSVKYNIIVLHTRLCCCRYTYIVQLSVAQGSSSSGSGSSSSLYAASSDEGKMKV